MKSIKDKFINLSKEKKKRNIGLAVVAFCLIMFYLSFTPDLSPIFHRNPVSIIKNIRNNLHNTIPVTYFTQTAKQNENIILNRPIQSAGCNIPVTLKTGTTSYIEISSGNKQRRFLVFLPKNYHNNSQHALVLAFHGYASNPFSFEQFTHFDSIADNNNTIIVYPEGTVSIAGLRGWNTGIHPTITVNDVLFVSNILNTVQSNLCVNPNQIYAVGFSNGGGLVAELACQLSDRIASFASVSGAYVNAFKTCDTQRPLSIIEFHGTKDSIVPYLGREAKKELAALRWVSLWAKRDNCSLQPILLSESDRITQYTWTNCSDNASIIHYKISGEGHTWPHVFFSEQSNNHLIWLSATNIIWNFFENHPMPKA